MEVENILFSNWFYQAQERSPNKPVMTPFVELLIAEREEELSAEEVNRQTAVFNKQDVWDEVVRHLYSPGVHQQYALNISVGSSNFSYFVTGGIDRINQQLKVNMDKRYTFTRT